MHLNERGKIAAHSSVEKKLSFFNVIFLSLLDFYSFILLSENRMCAIFILLLSCALPVIVTQ